MFEQQSGLVVPIDPILFRLGPAIVRWYGVAIAAGLVAGVYITARAARRRGVAEDVVYAAALWAILGGVVGARVLHVLDKLDYYLQNPYLLLDLGQGGLAMWGAIFGGLLAVRLYAGRRGLPALLLADLATPGLIVGQAIGRLGSLINGEAWGATTSLPWGLVYVSPDTAVPPTSLGLATHPYAAYELLWLLVVLAVVLRLRDRPMREGALSLIYLTLFAAGRFGLGFVREEGPALLGLQQSQVIAAAAFLVGVPWLVYLLTARRGVSGRARLAE